MQKRLGSREGKVAMDTDTHLLSKSDLDNVELGSEGARAYLEDGVGFPTGVPTRGYLDKVCAMRSDHQSTCEHRSPFC